MTHKTLALTMGDPAGIGPEITLKALAHLPDPSAFPILGDPRVMRAAADSFDTPLHLMATIDDRRTGAFNLLPTSQLTTLPALGTVSAEAGAAAYNAIAKGIALSLGGDIAGIVTAPIHKEALKAAGHSYPGHTEILADHAGVEVAMMLANDEIKTVLVTIHMALRDAIEAADYPAQIHAIKLAQQGLEAMGIPNPRIAVAGLNPHAGEGGRFGDEEIRIISPAIKAMQNEGLDVSGPWPGDTVYMMAREGRFDVVVAQYHDQGLIPVKYLGLEKGVNITLGLPFIRTSPDHGTAFDIAGQGKADPASMITALEMAQKLLYAKT
ncbi:MAG TPA: 4-hydroxythreonine-4-phosphate dehydrogenase PdxA [Rhodobacteraceae bacterium]|nr:4-hydroxythreonine-4-phosphate dehydrogenase PdxA [Paracoccaceae bacterium]